MRALAGVAVTRAELVARFALALFRNCQGYTERHRAYAVFSARNRRLWDMAQRAGISDAVRDTVTPRLCEAYPEWAARLNPSARRAFVRGTGGVA